MRNDAEAITADVLYKSGQSYLNSGDYLGAIRKFDSAIVSYERVPHQIGKVACLHAIGLAYTNLGRNDIASKYYLESAEISVAIGFVRGAASAALSLGACLLELGHHAEARRALEAAVGYFQQLGDPAGEADARQNLQYCYY